MRTPYDVVNQQQSIEFIMWYESCWDSCHQLFTVIIGIYVFYVLSIFVTNATNLLCQHV